MRTLLVEDDSKTASFILKGLKEAGFAVDDAGVAVRFASLLRQFERVDNHQRIILTNSLRLIVKM